MRLFLSIEIVAGIAAVIGLALVSASLVLYYKRTHDRIFWRRLWMSRHLLTSREFILNRIGFWSALAAVTVMWIFVAVIRLHK
jgi:hypothetical protein